jgi:hypothetical protein
MLLRAQRKIFLKWLKPFCAPGRYTGKEIEVQPDLAGLGRTVPEKECTVPSNGFREE